MKSAWRAMISSWKQYATSEIGDTEICSIICLAWLGQGWDCLRWLGVSTVALRQRLLGLRWKSNNYGHMGLSLGTGSCLWDARPAMCRFAYGFLPGSEHRALQPCVAFPIIANRFQLLQTVSNNVPPLLFHPFPVSSTVLPQVPQVRRTCIVSETFNIIGDCCGVSIAATITHVQW